MTNCKCGNPLREGESECDECLLNKYLRGIHSSVAFYRAGNETHNYYSTEDVAQALRRAEKEPTHERE